MNKSFEFVKMQGTGNDFIMVDARDLDMDWSKMSIDVCREHFGIGADGLITIDNSGFAGLKMRIFNADGSEAQICGNGLRCFAKYAVDRQLVKGPDLTIETAAGVKRVETTSEHGKVTRARVNMGKPVLKGSDIPVAIDEDGPILDQLVKVDGREIELSLVSMGNPHAVCFIKENVAKYPLLSVGPQVEHHNLFPQRTNFEIVNVVDGRRLQVRVWERGVGETLACGSGACAVAVVSRLKKITGESVDIMIPGGTLKISWDGKGDVYLEGPVEEVFSGVYEL
ncbi:MAG: diaminopimelate epimerase [Dehalococcoidia bacterium]|jgi:diaminopimelate epimerase